MAMTALFTLRGELLALAGAKMTSNQMMDASKGIAASPERVMISSKAYPKTWKSHSF